jgi:two-component system nitrate/nitrite response regulator NarL
MPGPNILICHRIPLFSECLTALLNGFGDVDCQMVTTEDALEPTSTSFDRVAIDLLLLDAAVDVDLSIRIAERIKGLHPNCKIVLLVADHAIDRLFEFAQIRSQGYVFEGMRLTDVRAAIQTVLEGQSYCSPLLINALLLQVGRVEHSPDQSRLDHAQLTSRQREILELIASQQLGNKQIARQLKISLYTVKNHVHNIIDKLGAQDRHEAVQLARRRGLLFGNGTQPEEADPIRPLR